MNQLSNSNETANPSSSNSLNNPFSNLIENLKETHQSSQQQLQTQSLSASISNELEFKQNRLFENIFQLTLDPNFSHPTNKCVFMGEVNQNGEFVSDDVLLREDNLDEILLQRLMLSDRNQLEARVRPSQTQSSNKTTKLELKCLEKSQFIYLFDCFKRLNDLKRHFERLNRLDLFDKLTKLILNVSRTIINIFESTANLELNLNENSSGHQHNQFGLDNKDNDLIYLIKNNPQAMNDLSIQFLVLVIDNLDDLDSNESHTTNTATSGTTAFSSRCLIENFFDKFIELFEKTDSISSILDKNDFTTNNLNTEKDLVDLFKIDLCEIKFLNNLFIYLNKYFIKLNQCDDYTNKYLKSLELVKFFTKQKLMKLLFIYNSFPSKNVTLNGVSFSHYGQNQHHSTASNSNNSNDLVSGRVWQVNTLIGKLLTPHALPLAIPKLPQHPGASASSSNPFSAVLNNLTASVAASQLNLEYRYFTNPTQLTKRDIEMQQKSISQIQCLIKKEQEQFFFEHLIRKNSNRLIRDFWLKWIGECLHSNRQKSQEWLGYMQTQMYLTNTEHLSKFSSDGLLLNLLDLLLNYSMPFCSSPYSNKLLKINFNYSVGQNVHFHGFEKETKFISLNNQLSTTQSESDTDFNFLTECFYATHSCIRLSYISLYQKLMKLSGELSRWQQTYQQLIENSRMISNDEQMSRLKTLYENMTTEFLNIKSALLENDLLNKLIKFLCSTCSWLVHLTIYADENYEKSSILYKLDDPDLIKRKTNSFNLQILSKIPEYFITNIVEFLIFLSRFKDSDIVDLFMTKTSANIEQTIEYSNLDALVSLILVFMGHSERLFNPHCRASLVEAIEIILPKKNQLNVSNLSSSYEYFNRKNLAYYVFAKHPCSSFISEALLNVFVSIEMTGQSVQFEQKFNYRRPMYELLEYLWNMPVLYSDDQNYDYDLNLLNQHRKKLSELADDAYLNINNSIQPLFLKFLNFLINDANFLLLEGLLYLEKIKTLQEKLDQSSMETRNEQNSSNTQDQQQSRNESEANLKHMIMLAKFHNFMSSKTLQTIRMLTSEVKNIFCHDVLVDRVATMLNDFLLHLVGKKRRQFKVKNMEEVEFHPKEIVSYICDIYLNLGTKESFCKAVCRDGRSYSAELFQLAKNVLELIPFDHKRSNTVIEEFSRLGEKIEELYRLQQLEELNFDDAPEDFLDPIMSNLMDDPVILPNSRKIVDRCTIARHLLSDQCDPFNREPLTLQDVIPATELKEQIEQWKASKRSK